MLGLELEIYNDKYFICDIIREELKDEININDQLIKINNKNIENLSLEGLIKFCKNLKNKNKKLEIISTY